MDLNQHYGEKCVRRKLDQLPKEPGLRRRKKIVLGIKAVFFSFLAAGCLGLCLGAGVYRGIVADTPDVSEINIGPGKYASFVYDVEGNQIQQINEAQSNRIHVSIEDIPEDMQHAIVAIEDSRFYEHHGIDPRGILRAAAVTVTSGFQETEGASTITQQLIKNNVFTDWTDENFFQSVRRKIQEQQLAVELEEYLTEQGLDAKSVILEEYLNTVNFGSGAYGIQTAARTYFGKDSRDLTLSECAVLAAIPQNPTKWDPRQNPEENAKRRETVLRYMRAQGWITQEEMNEALEDDVYSRIGNNSNVQGQTSTYSYFIDELISQVQEDLVEKKGYTQTQAANAIYSGGLQIYSTQDTRIQEIMEEEFEDEDNYPDYVRFDLDWALTVEHGDGSQENYSREMMEAYFREKGEEMPALFDTRAEAQGYADRYKEAILGSEDEIIAERLDLIPQPQAAMTVMDQSTGYVLGIVGGRGEKEASLTLNRASDTYRQPGSTFKILSAYGPALEEGDITLATHIQDEEYSYEDGTPLRNSDNQYHGSVSVRQAIRNSYNIPAVKVLTDITPAEGFSYLQKLGFTTLDEERDEIQPLALGGITNGVSNLELTAAYAAIADGGIYREPVFYTEVTDQDGKVILSNDIQGQRVFKESTAFLLTSAMEDVVSQGTGTGFALEDMHEAGKTGTANDYRDLTFAGFTPYYTAAIWAGYDDPQDLPQSHRTFHRTLWRNVMNRIHEDLPDRDFEQPSTVERTAVCAESGLLAGRGCTRIYEYFDQDNMPRETCTEHRPSLFSGWNKRQDGDEDSNGSSGNRNDNNSGGSASSWWDSWMKWWSGH